MIKIEMISIQDEEENVVFSAPPFPGIETVPRVTDFLWITHSRDGDHVFFHSV